MKIKIVCVGKKHESWVKEGIEEFTKRLRQPFAAEFIILPNSSKPEIARDDESERILRQLDQNSWVILLDERGKNLSSPELKEVIIENTQQQLVIVIGGAYGVNDEFRARANLIWSLSRLVFPHQLVRLILTEQLYRAQEIHKGSSYHHN